MYKLICEEKLALAKWFLNKIKNVWLFDIVEMFYFIQQDEETKTLVLLKSYQNC